MSLTLKSYPSNYPTIHNSDQLHISSYPMVQPYPYSYLSYSYDYYVSYLNLHFQIVVASLNRECRARVLPRERRGLLVQRLLYIYHSVCFVVEYASFICNRATICGACYCKLQWKNRNNEKRHLGMRTPQLRTIQI